MRHVVGLGLPLVVVLGGFATAILITGRWEAAVLIVLGTIAIVYTAIGVVAYRLGLRYGRRRNS